MDEKLIIISPFPSKYSVYDNKYSALASFAKNTVTALTNKVANLQILILADKIPAGVNWSSNNVTVKRVWERNKLSCYWYLLIECLRLRHFKKVLIELEWGLFGKSPFLISLMPLFIILLRLLGKEVSVVSHGIVLDFSPLSAQLGIKNNSFKASIYNWGIKLFYFGLVLATKNIIVLEQYFAELINSYFHTQKAVFIPHGVDTNFKVLSKEEARKELKLDRDAYLILFFGFQNWYKGVDIIVNLIKGYEKKNPLSNIQLIMAGGESLIHKNDKTYQKYIDEVKQKVNSSKRIKITGFLEEGNFNLYFCAADLVVFPYRILISSSGPLSLAFTFKKPILLSSQLKGYLSSSDFINSMNEAGLKEVTLFFETDGSDFKEKIDSVKANVEKLKRFSILMREKRDWVNVAHLYRKVLQLGR